MDIEAAEKQVETEKMRLPKPKQRKSELPPTLDSMKLI